MVSWLGWPAVLVAATLTTVSPLSTSTIDRAVLDRTILSDHQIIMSLNDQISKLQDQVDALSLKYQHHTHHLRVGVALVDNGVVCDASIAAIGNPGRVCHAEVPGTVGMLTTGGGGGSLDTSEPNQ